MAHFLRKNIGFIFAKNNSTGITGNQKEEKAEKSSPILLTMPTWANRSLEQCDHIGRFFALWATFQSLWDQLFSQNRPHF